MGVSKNANLNEIKRAWRKLSQKMHPDLNKDDPNANEKFAKINNGMNINIKQNDFSIYLIFIISMLEY